MASYAGNDSLGLFFTATPAHQRALAASWCKAAGLQTPLTEHFWSALKSQSADQLAAQRHDQLVAVFFQ